MVAISTIDLIKNPAAALCVLLVNKYALSAPGVEIRQGRNWSASSCADWKSVNIPIFTGLVIQLELNFG